MIEFKDIHKHYCKLVTGGLWLSYLWGYVNVSQLGQSDLNPGNCSENNINMYTLKKIYQNTASQATLFFCSLAFLDNCSVLFCIQMAFYSSSTWWGWGNFLSFIHLKQKNDNFKFLSIKQRSSYNTYKK